MYSRLGFAADHIDEVWGLARQNCYCMKDKGQTNGLTKYLQRQIRCQLPFEVNLLAEDSVGRLVHRSRLNRCFPQHLLTSDQPDPKQHRPTQSEETHFSLGESQGVGGPCKLC